MQDSKSVAAAVAPNTGVGRKYDMRRLSYAGTFTNPVNVFTIRALEWLTAKVKLL